MLNSGERKRIHVGFPIGIPLRGIERNGNFRLCHFIARNHAIIANKEASKYSRNSIYIG